MDKISLAVALVVTLIVAGVAGVVLIEIDGQMDASDEALHDRAGEVYGDEYRIVESSECWDLCVPTATTLEQQQADILYVLMIRGGYVPETVLMDNTAGYVLDERLEAALLDTGKVTMREGDGFGSQAEYKYTGELTPVMPISDAEVRQRVLQRLYLTGTSMSSDAIADDLPVRKSRVQTALATMKATGKVDDGRANPGFVGEHQWIDTRHGTLPDGWLDQYGPVVDALILVLLATALIGAIQRFRSGAEADP